MAPEELPVTGVGRAVGGGSAGAPIAATSPYRSHTFVPPLGEARLGRYKSFSGTEDLNTTRTPRQGAIRR